MDYKNRLKGEITQALLKCLLIDAGYHIVPLGIEEVIREVNALDKERYKSLGLPTVLRRMPDFFVADKNYQKCHLVEVKYRKEWSDAVRDALVENLLPQLKTWESIVLIIFLGNSALPHIQKETPAHFIKCAYIEKHTWPDGTDDFDFWGDHEHPIPLKSIEWNTMLRIQDVFSDVANRHEEKTIIKITELLKSLRTLDIF